MNDLTDIRDRLSEIGLAESEISRFCELADNKEAQIRLLNNARYGILSAIHEKEKKIQQIDNLIFILNGK